MGLFYKIWMVKLDYSGSVLSTAYLHKTALFNCLQLIMKIEDFEQCRNCGYSHLWRWLPVNQTAETAES